MMFKFTMHWDAQLKIFNIVHKFSTILNRKSNTSDCSAMVELNKYYKFPMQENHSCHTNLNNPSSMQHNTEKRWILSYGKSIKTPERNSTRSDFVSMHKVGKYRGLVNIKVCRSTP